MLGNQGQADETVAFALDAAPPAPLPAVSAASLDQGKDAPETASGACFGWNVRLRAPQTSRGVGSHASKGPVNGKETAATETPIMRGIIANQMEVTGYLLLAVLSAYVLGVPGAAKFVTLCERRAREDGSVYYLKSRDDVFLVAFYAVLFTFLRSATMTYVLIPFAQRWFVRGEAREKKQRANGSIGAATQANSGVRKRGNASSRDVSDSAGRSPEGGKGFGRRTSLATTAARPSKAAHPKAVRFAEQGWVFLYYSVYWVIGTYVMYHSPTWYYRTKAFWEDFPHLEMSALQKWYYLTQAGFWMSQLWVVQTETKRKDHAEMVLHHIVTSALIISSYILNFTRIGTAVFVMMDVSDILLPLAKMLLYLKLQRACDIVFVIFVLSWIYARHYLYFFVVKSVWLESSILATYPPHPENPYNEPGKYAFVALFLILQVLVLYWFSLICNILYGVVTGKGADDTREGSSDEESDITEVANGNPNFGEAEEKRKELETPTCACPAAE